jgi:hypothetical protein
MACFRLGCNDNLNAVVLLGFLPKFWERACTRAPLEAFDNLGNRPANWTGVDQAFAALPALLLGSGTVGLDRRELSAHTPNVPAGHGPTTC